MKIRLVTALRVLGFLLGGVVAAVAALALLIWISFDAEHTATALSQHFQETYQRTLILAQTPRLQIWPRPALIVEDASLSEPGRAEIFARVDRARLDLALVPLLTLHHEVFRIQLDGLQARLVHGRDGDWNLADLLFAPNPDLTALPWRQRLDALRLRDAQLEIRDARSERQVEVRELQAEAAGASHGEPGPLRWQGQWLDKAHGRDLHFKGEARYTLLNGLSAGTLDGLSIDLRGEGFGLKAGNGRFVADRLGWSSKATQGVLKAARLSAQGTAKAGTVEVTAYFPDVAWQDSRLQGEKLAARLKLRGADTQGNLQIELPRLVEAEHGFTAERLGLTWQQQTGPRSGSQGQFAARLEANLEEGDYRLAALAGTLSVRDPHLRPAVANLAVSGQATWHRNGGIDCALDGQFGPDHLLVSAQLQKPWPATGQFTLTSNQFDLDRLFLASSLEFPRLAGVSLDGKLSLTKLHVGGRLLDRLQTALIINQDSLKASALSASLYGGQLSGEFSADPASGRLAGSGEFSDLALGPLARDGKWPLPLDGRLSGSYKLSAVSKPGAAMLPTLDGALRWRLANASLRGADLIRSVQEFRPAIEAGSAAARHPGEGEKTELGSLSSRFVFTQGALQADTLQSRNAALALSGGGTANLRTNTLDFSLQASVLPAAGKDLAGLRGKPLSLRLQGPLLRPEVRYEPGAAPAAATPAKPGAKK